MSLQNVKTQLEQFVIANSDHRKSAAEGLLADITFFETNPNNRLLFKTKVSKARQFYLGKRDSQDIIKACDDILKYS